MVLGVSNVGRWTVKGRQIKSTRCETVKEGGHMVSKWTKLRSCGGEVDGKLHIDYDGGDVVVLSGTEEVVGWTR